MRLFILGSVKAALRAARDHGTTLDDVKFFPTLGFTVGTSPDQEIAFKWFLETPTAPFPEGTLLYYTSIRIQPEANC